MKAKIGGGRKPRQTKRQREAEAIQLSRQIRLRPVNSLVPDPRNSRTHSPQQVNQIAASIREFGFTMPILVSGDQIVAGEGRWLASQKLALERVPTIDAGYMTPAQRRAYVIADNKLALNAGWNEEILTAELAELKDLHAFDVSTIGFTARELKGLGVGGPGEAGDASVSKVPTTWAVIVECKDEQDQVALIAAMEATGRKARGLVS